MTKLEIARELAERKDMPLADAIKSVDGVIDIMKDAFKNGRNVYLRGLGSFVIKERKEKAGPTHELEKLSSYLHTMRQSSINHNHSSLNSNHYGKDRA